MKKLVKKFSNCPSYTGLANDRQEGELKLRTEIRKLQTELRDICEANKSFEREAAEAEKEINRLEGEKSKTVARCRTLENELRITRQQVEELLSTNLDNENVIRMKVRSPILQSHYQDSQISLLQESLHQRTVHELNTEDYEAIVDSHQFLEQQVQELTVATNQANEARQKAEQAKKNATDQLYTLRQEAEIQREDLRSAELETKKAWKIVAEANSKVSAHVKDLKEAKESKLELITKVEALQRTVDDISSSARLGNVEKSRLETEISTLQRRVKMEQELARRAEADLAAKTRELAEVKKSDSELSKLKINTLNEQKDKLEAALRDWQNKHAELASRLDASETHKSRIVLEIEDLAIPNMLCTN